MVGHSFVGFVERMRLGKLGLVVHQAQLLASVENRIFVLVLFGRVSKLDIHIFFFLFRQIVFVLQIGKRLLAADLPSQKCVMRDETHMISIHGSEGSQSITHDGEETDQNVIDDVNEVGLFSADVDPACIEKSVGV